VKDRGFADSFSFNFRHFRENGFQVPENDFSCGGNQPDHPSGKTRKQLHAFAGQTAQKKDNDKRKTVFCSVTDIMQKMPQFYHLL
jgi:hypothetical protein